MDRLDAMAILIAVADAGSLSAASRKLGVPLPTVSRKVSELEGHLKTRLLIRSTRKLTLTDAGAGYVEACLRILEQVGDAERTAAGEFSVPRGNLVVTAPIVFGRLHVLPAINAFLKTYPEINVRLVLSDRNVHLIDDNIDLAVRIGALPDSSLVATRVGAVRYVVCASPAYLDAHGTPNVPEDLSALACVSFDMLPASNVWTFSPAASHAARTVPIQSRLSVNTAEAAIDAAIAGIGVTRVLSYQAACAVAEGKLRFVLADYEAAPLPIHLVHIGQGRMPLKLRACLDFIAPRIRDSAAAPPLGAGKRGAKRK